MKKYILLILLIIIALTSIAYLYISYTNNIKKVEISNKIYENLYGKEITGTEFATVINKVIDSNEKNKVQKGEDLKFIDNQVNSIIVEVKFKDSDNVFRIEAIDKNGIENFINLYSNLKFKCIQINYHKKTKLVSYLYFEEV